MSNGIPDSGSPYIIICSIRTTIAAADDPKTKVVAASQGAATLAAFMQANLKVKPADLKEISVLQHDMMDNFHRYDLDGAEAVCREMVGLLYELENKFR